MGKEANQSKKKNNDTEDPYKIGTVLFTSGDSKHDDVWDDSELIEHWDKNVEAYRKMYSSENVEQAEKPPYQQQKHRKTQGGYISKKKPTVSRKANNLPQSNQQIPTQQPQSTSFLPPMPPLPSSQEELSNLIMAWYYCGYYTGLYQAQK